MNDRTRVLVIGPTDSFFTGPHEQAFKDLGFECTTFYTRRGLVYSSHNLRRLIRAFPVLRFIKRWSVSAENRKLVRFVRRYKPWLLFGVKAETIKPETVKEIRSMGVVTALFFNDLFDHWEHIKTVAPAYDYFFNQDHYILRKLRDELGLKNVYYMPHAMEPLKDPFTHRDNIYPVSFIGTHSETLYASREKYLLAVKDLGLNIWGSEGWAKTSVSDCYHGRSYSDQRFDIYRHSKIIVDINWSNLPSEGLSNRPFEVTGCGALFMTDNIRADIYRAYEVGKEVIVFTDEHDLRQKAQYYLEHEAERDAIARAGYAKTVLRHTYVERNKMLLDVIQNPTRYPIQ